MAIAHLKSAINITSQMLITFIETNRQSMHAVSISRATMPSTWRELWKENGVCDLYNLNLLYVVRFSNCSIIVAYLFDAIIVRSYKSWQQHNVKEPSMMVIRVVTLVEPSWRAFIIMHVHMSICSCILSSHRCETKGYFEIFTLLS